jgi:acyl carrier protein
MQNIVEELSIVLKPDSSLPDLLDSVTFIKMVVALESEFEFEFDDDMLLIEKFPTADDMIQYVESKIAP